MTQAGARFLIEVRELLREAGLSRRRTYRAPMEDYYREALSIERDRLVAKRAVPTP